MTNNPVNPTKDGNALTRFLNSEAQLGKERTMAALGAVATASFFGLGMAYRSVELPTKATAAVVGGCFKVALGAAGLALAVPGIMKDVLEQSRQGRKEQLGQLLQSMRDTKLKTLGSAITNSPALTEKQKEDLVHGIEQGIKNLKARQEKRVASSGLLSAAVNEALERIQVFRFGRSQSRIMAGIKALNSFDQKFCQRDSDMSAKCNEFCADLVNKAADGHFSLVESLRFRAKLAVRSAFESASSFIRKLAPNPFASAK